MWQDFEVKAGFVLAWESVGVLVLKVLKVYDKHALARFVG